MKDRRVFFAAVALAAIALLLPNLIFPYFEDTAGYAAVAKLHREGLALYRDLFDQKPPGIFYQEEVRLALFGRTSLAARASEIALLVFAGLALGLVVDLVLPKERRDGGRALVAVAFAGLSSSALWGLPERGQVEFYQAAWIAIAIGATAAALRDPEEARDRPRLALAALAGAAAAWACWLKPQAALIAPVPLVVLAIERRKLATVFAGAGAIVTAIVLARLAMRGELAAFRDLMFRFNPAYVKLGGGVDLFAAIRRSVQLWVLSARGAIGLAIAVAGGFAIAKSGATRAQKVMLFWPVPWAVFQFASGAFLFDYQVVPTIVGIAILLGVGGAFALSRLEMLRTPIRAAVAAMVVLLLVVNGRFVDAAGDLARWATGSLGTTQLYALRGNERHYFRYAQQREAARVVERYVPPGETFYVFGRAAVTYLFADRHPAMRHLATTMGYLPIPPAKEVRDEIVHALIAKPPKLLLVRTNDAFPWFGLPIPSSGILEQDRDLAPFVAEHYRTIGKIGDGFLVMERIGG